MIRRSALVGLAGVTAVSLASGWVGVLANRALGRPQDLDGPGAALWLLGPAAATAVARAADPRPGVGGWDPRTPLRWYALAIVAYPAMAGAALELGRRCGWVDTADLRPRAAVLSALRSAGPGLVKNLGEESAWRGGLVDGLVRAGASDLQVSLGSGVVWGMWHLPYYLVFLPEQDLRAVLDVRRGTFALVAAGTMLAWAVPYAELYRLSGSVWPGVVLHTVEDCCNVLLLDGHVRVEPRYAWLVSPVVGAVSAGLHLGLGLTLRALRRRTGASGSLA